MRVDALAEQIIDYRGKTPPKTSSGVPLITAKVIKSGRILQTSEYISEETYGSWMTRGFPQQWDMLVTTEAPLGEVALLRTADRIALAQRVILIRGRPDVVDQRFLAYSFQSPLVQSRLQARATGTTVRGIKQSELRQLDVPLPPLDTQQKIAGLLAAYDELIENNLRRIELLEDMAQAVYREWFVNFRFPGSSLDDGRQLVDGVPYGWEERPVSDTFEILGGATPSTKRDEYWDGGTINWYTPSDLTAHGQMFIERSTRRITEQGLAGCSATLFPPGAVMMTSRATLGVLAINLEPACTNQGFITCLPNDRAPAPLIYFWIKDKLPLIESLASGATFKEITKRAFREIPFLLPPVGLVTAFVERVEPMMALTANLIRQNANLRETRDLLLPRLVSGEIDVSDLDIDTEWLAS